MANCPEKIDTLSENLDEVDDISSSVPSDFIPDVEKSSSRRTKYRVITQEKRLDLINLIEIDGLSISKVKKNLVA